MIRAASFDTPRAAPAPSSDSARGEIAQFLDAVLANSTEAIVIVDELGDILLATRGLADLLGHAPAALVGTSAFAHLHPDDVDVVADRFVQRLDYHGRDAGKDLRIRHATGEWIEANATVSLLPTFGAAAVTVRTALSTSREQSLERRIAVAEFASGLGAGLMSADGPDAMLARIRTSLAEVGLLTGADVVAVYLEHLDRTGLELLAGWRSPGIDDDAPIEVVHDECTVERIVTEHLVVDDLRLDRHRALAALTAPLGADGLITAPFATDGRRGTVVLARCRTGPSWWDSDSELARSVASLYARALHSAWSEQLLSSTYRYGPVAFSIRTWDGELVDCNRRYLQMLGLNRRELSQLTWDDLVVEPPTADEMVEWEAMRAGATDRFRREFEVIHRDGSRIWVRSNSVPLSAPGHPERFVLTAFDDITEQRRQQLELEHAATHDSLTGVANRAQLYDHLTRSSTGSAELPALLMLDLDRFKLVNDGHGHAVGDAVLTSIARRIRRQVRCDDLVARLGGDEFAVIAPGLDATAATELARRLRRTLERPMFVHGRRITQTVSVGVAIGADAADVPDLLVRADRALYSAKHQGRNQHVLFDDSMHDAVLERLTVERDLRRALDAGELDVHFQPEFDVASRRIVGAEALVRWHHPERGLVPAAEFVPIAEQCGLIDEVGRFALRQATEMFARLLLHLDGQRLDDQHPDEFHLDSQHLDELTGADQSSEHLLLRVNISAGEFNRAELTDVVIEALASSGLPASRLCIEITETALMDAAETALTTLTDLRELGVRVAIDDFGTGYSSLAYLKQFAVDAIKIDRSFVRDIVDDPGSRAIVRSVIGLCDALGLEAVAEGVETVEQLELLEQLGCTRAQGFLVAPALPIHRLEAMIVGC